MKKIKSIVLILLIVILVFFISNIVYSKLIKKDVVISILGNSFFIVETGSMEPVIEVGELIVSSKNEDYKIGDIVTIIDKNNCIYTHRIIEKNENGIITRGDSNNINDENTKSDKIIGKVVFHSKVLGFFVIYILKPLIIIEIIVLFIKLFIEIMEDTDEKEFDN